MLGATVRLVAWSYLVSGEVNHGSGDAHHSVNKQIIFATSVPLIGMPLGVYIGVTTAPERWRTLVISPGIGHSALGGHTLRMSAAFVF